MQVLENQVIPFEQFAIPEENECVPFGNNDEWDRDNQRICHLRLEVP